MFEDGESLLFNLFFKKKLVSGNAYMNNSKKECCGTSY